ncbi:Carboxypeptidase_Taq_(M32)_metallopeptidase (plasmid) [Leishmania braziliensis MHOM/BR/75/M2904]|uniref:Carboxypeptidase_Taq_(M32)_metallopeptidase n=1 Tax=Leishmania braziliensis MHOM/BR/75/M2904 TaxID=420245 RepID=A0A3P3Z1F7_LEIBR|nr:Carboxypeptidase_Taq_(M32)_metallopeptidase [Leishmania braziliensis MHOM/BR/75/M2904]
MDTRPVELPIPIAEENLVMFGRQLMRALWKYVWDVGRYDELPHPFGGMVMEASQMKYCWLPDSRIGCLLATIHEIGHTQYRQNCGSRELLGQPVCEAHSMTIHESQSHLVEYLTPALRDSFSDQPALTVDKACKTNQWVACGYNRVKEDEGSCSWHILLRYEIECNVVED